VVAGHRLRWQDRGHDYLRSAAFMRGDVYLEWS